MTRTSVFISDGDSEQPVICAAHPADELNDGTARLLAAAAGARVVCINSRGATLAEMVDDLEAERQRLALPPWIFWGMSAGGWLGQLYAHRHPHALTHLILESACACFRLRLADAACLASPFHPAWRPRVEAAGLLDAHAHDDAGPVDDLEWHDIPGLGLVFRHPGGPALMVAPMALPPSLLAITPELWRFDSRAWLAQLSLPTLIIAGSADPIVPLAHAQALQQQIAGSQWLIVDGAGHVPVTEKREEVSGAVRALLSSRRSS